MFHSPRHVMPFCSPRDTVLFGLRNEGPKRLMRWMSRVAQLGCTMLATS